MSEFANQEAEVSCGIRFDEDLDACTTSSCILCQPPGSLALQDSSNASDFPRLHIRLVVEDVAFWYWKSRMDAGYFLRFIHVV